MNYFTPEYFNFISCRKEPYKYEELKSSYIEMTDALSDLFPLTDEGVAKPLKLLTLHVTIFDIHFMSLGMTPELSKYQKSIFFEEAKPALIEGVKSLLPILDKKEGVVSQEDTQNLYRCIMNIHAAIFAFKKFFPVL
jgi:hypothetical protein